MHWQKYKNYYIAVGATIAGLSIGYLLYKTHKGKENLEISKENFAWGSEDHIKYVELPDQIKYIESTKDFLSKKPESWDLIFYKWRIDNLKITINHLENIWLPKANSAEIIVEINNTIEKAKDALSKVEAMKKVAYPSE